MKILWIFLFIYFFFFWEGGGHHKTGLVLSVIFMHFRVNVQNGDIFVGC